jgi:hypothetical protein
MGSGTILVEAIVNERQIYGIDINPVSIFSSLLDLLNKAILYK